MGIEFIIKGILIGISVAAPIGPISLLVIRRTIENGRNAGIVTGMGAATGDAFYGVVAAFGLTFISSALIENEQIIRTAGSIFLIYLGIKFLMQKGGKQIQSNEITSRNGLFWGTFALTISNPATILTFVGLFGSIGLIDTFYDASLLVAGVFSGSALWCIFLCNVINHFGTKNPGSLIRVAKKVSAWMIIGFGIWMMYSVKFNQLF